MVNIGFTKSPLHATFWVFCLAIQFCKRLKHLQRNRHRRDLTKFCPKASTDPELKRNKQLIDKKFSHLKGLDGFFLGEALDYSSIASDKKVHLKDLDGVE